MRLWLFPKLVLVKEPGNHTTRIRARLRLWREQQYTDLLAMSQRAIASRPARRANLGVPIEDDSNFASGGFSTDAQDVPEHIANRAKKLTDRGLFGKALTRQSKSV